MEKTCPICHGKNHCQIEDTTKHCWCTQYTFTEEMNEALKQLPTRCICEACAQKLGAIRK